MIHKICQFDSAMEKSYDLRTYQFFPWMPSQHIVYAVSGFMIIDAQLPVSDL